MVQLRHVAFLCLGFSLSNGLSSGPKSINFNFGGSGNCDFVPTATDDKTGFVGAKGHYGGVNIQYQNNRKNSEAKWFMQDFDPSNFMQTGQANADQSKPTELQFAVEGNVSLTLEDLPLRCPLRIGLRKTENHERWYIGGTNCQKSKAEPDDPKPGRPNLFNLECECDNATRVMFSMKESEKTSAANTVKTTISDCTAILASRGRWVQVGSSPAPQTLQLTYGVQHSTTVKTTKAWGKATTHETTVGFSFLIGKVSHTVAHTTARLFATSHVDTFSTTEQTTFSTSLPAGVAWQFQMDVDDNCGTSGVHMNDVAFTASALEQPCCLPGFFLNVSNAHGDCITSEDGDNINVCKDQQPVLEDAVLL